MLDSFRFFLQVQDLSRP
uniref:Uncharacterized protein n=1 Tax=Rhizophora mucronata TaxID=61149 RepID=A0A2P2MFJ2_RHIMU